MIIDYSSSLLNLLYRFKIMIRQTPRHTLQNYCLLKSDVQMGHLAKENFTLAGGMPHLLAMRMIFQGLNTCGS